MKPTANRVLLKKEEASQLSETIHISGGYSDDTPFYTVQSVGDYVASVSVGDRVVVEGCMSLEYNGEEFFICDEPQVMAVIGD